MTNEANSIHQNNDVNSLQESPEIHATRLQKLKDLGIYGANFKAKDYKIKIRTRWIESAECLKSNESKN